MDPMIEQGRRERERNRDSGITKATNERELCHTDRLTCYFLR
jgi:hypothetical protein